MASGPAVSIVVPVYNAAPFLRDCVDSVFAQTFADWELILVDDGSADDSRAVCDGYAARDARIRVTSQGNRGPAAARNAGVRLAGGRYVMFLDADDRLFDHALATLIAEAGRSDADLVLGNFMKLQGGVLLSQPVTFSPSAAPFDSASATLAGIELLHYVRHFLAVPSNHLVSYCWARLYRRSIIAQHDLHAREDMRLFEDFAFNLDYMGKVGRLVFVNEPVYVYVQHEGHLSASMAILDAAQLERDMEIFRQKIDAFLAGLGIGGEQARQVAREVGHALVHYAIIFLVRTCRQLNPGNRAAILAEVGKLVDAPIMRQSLPCYRPRAGDSRLVPWLMRLKWLRALAAVCRWKGERRYGRLAERAA